MTYRADIDGLRAVAVLSVLLFHVGVPGFSGGFVGVDVFFVISGYLICGMIDAQLRAGTFSLGSFYKRRILRIVPALAVMMLVTSALAYRYFLPVELKDYAVSLAAAVASVSNMYFAVKAGYFDAPALTKPLLHTWSLGVEEQFYVVVPLLMLLVARYAPHRLRLVLAAAALLSVILAALALTRNVSVAFYFAPCRAWQLLLGALLALGALPVPRDARLRHGIGLAGLALILGTVLLGSDKTPFLVISGLASLGAVMVIASSEPSSGHDPSIVGRLLALPPLVFVGLISYSVYLWHWPILVFERSDAFLPGDLSQGATQAVVIALSLALGTASWAFVERPFRAAAPRAPLLPVFGGCAAAMLALCGLSGLLIGLDGVPSRFSPQLARIGSYLAYDYASAFRHGQCYVFGRGQSLDEDSCLRLASDRPNYLLIGDSHAAHLWHGLSAALPGVNVLQASMSLCRPLVVEEPEAGPCPELRSRVLDDFLSHTKVDKVLLAAAWQDGDLPALSRTINALQARGLKVVVLGPIVEYERPFPRILADQILRHDPALGRRTREAGIPERDRRLRALVTGKGADYVSVYDAVCPGGACQETTADGGPLQFDTEHLTAEGSRVIAQRLVENEAFSR